MRLRDQDRLKKGINKFVYNEGTYVYSVEETISTGTSDYDTYGEEETVTQVRYRVPAVISWEPKVRYVGVGDGVIYGKTAHITLWGIPYDFISLFQNNQLVEVPNVDQSSSNACRVLSVDVDQSGTIFSVYLEKRN